jgi:pyruvate/2-oxoglutarate dehydrogenase complex dihydrolipoamide acyltransferase (E2) component
VALGDEIRIREVLHMTVLVDHDVFDGAPMVRMLDTLNREIESPSEVK